MTQEGRLGGSQRNLQVNVREIPDGSQVETTDGATVEIVSNPHDGIWLLVRYIASPNDPSLVGTEDMLWVDNVVSVTEPA